MQTEIEPKTIEVGTKLPPLEKCVSDVQVALSYRRLLLLTAALDHRFTSYIKEPNIHTDDKAAREAGFSGRVAPGLQTYSFISEMLGCFFGIHWVAGGKIRLKFLRPFLIGENITCEAEVTRIEGPEKSGTRLAELEVNCKNAAGDIVTNGSARVRIR